MGFPRSGNGLNGTHVPNFEGISLARVLLLAPVMKIRFSRNALVFALTLSSLASVYASDGLEYHYPRYPIGASTAGENFSPISRLLIPREGARLEMPVTIEVDHLVLEGPLLTQGHGLAINARRIEFRGEGRITASEGMLPPPVLIVPEARAGTASKPTRSGAPGYTGNPGIDGAQNPGDIQIFAAEVIGLPRVDGRGQDGGMGGKGGNGQAGARGKTGADAKCSCNPFDFKDVPARNGGAGGEGGAGGKGGTGGAGGRGVAILWADASEGPIDLSQVISAPGRGGSGGEPGIMGKGGAGGPGGDGCRDRLEALVFTCKIDNPAGRIGPANTVKGKTLGIGVPGRTADPSGAGVVTRRFGSLESMRRATQQEWYQIHFERQYVFLLQDSVRWMLDQDITREQIRSQPTLNDLLGRVQLANLKWIVHAWDTELLAPLKLHLERKPGNSELRGRVAEIEAVFGAMRGLLEASDEIQSARARGQLSAAVTLQLERFDTSASRGIRFCQDYQAALLEQSNLVASLTQQFQIPVCEQAATLVQNPELNIILSVPLRGLVLGANGSEQSVASLSSGSALTIQTAPGVRKKPGTRKFSRISPTDPVQERFRSVAILALDVYSPEAL